MYKPVYCKTMFNTLLNHYYTVLCDLHESGSKLSLLCSVYCIVCITISCCTLQSVLYYMMSFQTVPRLLYTGNCMCVCVCVCKCVCL